MGSIVTFGMGEKEYEAFSTLHSTLPRMSILPNAPLEDELEKNLMRSFPTAPRRKPKQNNFTRPRPKTPNVRDGNFLPVLLCVVTASARTPISSPHPHLRYQGCKSCVHAKDQRDEAFCVSLSIFASLFTFFPRFLPSVQMHTRQGVPSAVWHKQFVEVAHTFQPGSERRRVRAAAPTLTLTSSLSSSSRPASGGDGLGLDGGDEQQQQQEHQQKQKQKKKQSWPVDGRLSTHQGAYNDGLPWTKSPCIARQVEEQEARERGRKPDPDWTFKPNLSRDKKIAKLIKEEWRPEEVFNRYKIHTYRHFDRPLAYSLQPMKFVVKKPMVNLADSKHAWRTDVEPEEGKDGRGRAYGRALWEDAMKSKQRKNEAWDELIAPSLVRTRAPHP